jgi:hypothetical protein
MRAVPLCPVRNEVRTLFAAAAVAVGRIVPSFSASIGPDPLGPLALPLWRTVLPPGGDPGEEPEPFGHAHKLAVAGVREQCVARDCARRPGAGIDKSGALVTIEMADESPWGRQCRLQGGGGVVRQQIEQSAADIRIPGHAGRCLRLSEGGVDFLRCRQTIGFHAERLAQ